MRWPNCTSDTRKSTASSASWPLIQTESRAGTCQKGNVAGAAHQLSDGSGARSDHPITAATTEFKT